MNTHLHDPQLIGYVHFTLTDAERETMDGHLRDCALCRARLETFESLERRVRYELSADIKSALPPSTMTFSAIAPRLERQSWWDRLRIPSDQLLPGAAASAALAGLAVALISVLYALGWSDARAETGSSDVLYRCWQVGSLRRQLWAISVGEPVFPDACFCPDCLLLSCGSELHSWASKSSLPYLIWSPGFFIQVSLRGLRRWGHGFWFR